MMKLFDSRITPEKRILNVGARNSRLGEAMLSEKF